MAKHTEFCKTASHTLSPLETLFARIQVDIMNLKQTVNEQAFEIYCLKNPEERGKYLAFTDGILVAESRTRAAITHYCKARSMRDRVVYVGFFK